MTDEVTFLREMLEIYSPSGREGEIAAYLVARMREMGFRAYLDGAGNAVGIMGEGERELMLLSHMDTVEGFIPVRIQDGRLYGRGAVDAKGPLAACILAAARVGPIPGWRIAVVGAVEEESSSRGARHLLGHFSPRAVIIGEPSGWEHITLGYKGRLRVLYRLAAPVRHSTAEGPSAAEQAVRFWNRLTEFAGELNRGERFRFHTLDPTLHKITTYNGGFEEEVVMDITLRLPLGMSIPEIKDRIRSWAGDAAVGFSGEDVPYKAEKNTLLVRAFLQAIRRLGGNPTFKVKLGTSDMNTVGPAWRCPIVAYGPGDSRLDHTPEEHLDLKEFQRAIRVLEAVIQEIAQS
ncbi:MAG: [LysW]-lysine hydrolase [Anaerolineae bacterium]|nr:[LysW]-lysine hydrolase [Anaerolineae bacterium]MDW8067794.1 [LysW]-lysine hydrolase [Anaerolineae bacterium]